MVQPKLIHGMRIEFAILPTIEQQQDDVWRTPIRDTHEWLEDPNTPRIIVKAQVNFSRFEALVPVGTGSNEDTDGYLIIVERDQERHQFKVNDHVIRLLPRGKKPICTQLRITEVQPVAQRGTFGLVQMKFKDDSRGNP